MIAIRVEDFLIEQVDILAKSKHTNRSALIREAIIRFLEDNEDLAMALHAKKTMTHAEPIAKVRKELEELDDSDQRSS
jgi:RHH-type transcriptional regulator, rel operon repressor / antitoxin RelB